MKKMMKENTIKKIALIILIVFTFNIIVPTYSSAGWAKSLLSKPLATFCMEILGGVNLSLGEIFGGDEALESSTDTPDDDADKTEEIDLSVLDGKWSEV